MAKPRPIHARIREQEEKLKKLRLQRDIQKKKEELKVMRKIR